MAIDNVYMFSYFQETNGYNGLHLAYSLDGLSYHAVNGERGNCTRHSKHSFYARS